MTIIIVIWVLLSAVHITNRKGVKETTRNTLDSVVAVGGGY